MATLVTGGTGYIGSHTVVALHDCGREVVVLDDFSNSSPNVVDALRRLTAADLVVVEGDATRRDTLDRVFADHEIDSVIHFAAHKAVGESVEQPLRYYRNNLVSTITLAEVMVERGCESLVFSSSATVYGEVSDVPVTEEAPATGSINPYGWTKFMNEQILADTSAVTPLRVVLLRYFNPVGAHPSGLIGEDPRETPNNLAPFVMQVAVGRLEKLSVFGADYDTPDGTAIRDYVHVVDLAEGHVAALDSFQRVDGACRVYNLGTGVGSSVLELVEAARAAVGVPIPYEITGRRSGDVERIWADCQKAADELGWRADRDLAEMLRDHWNWQKRNPDGFG